MQVVSVLRTAMVCYCTYNTAVIAVHLRGVLCVVTVCSSDAHIFNPTTHRSIRSLALASATSFSVNPFHSVAAPMSQPSQPDALCKRAAAWIVKYDLNGGELVRIKPRETVVDPTNRDRQFSAFSDVLRLGEDVAGIGYSIRYAKAIVTQLPVDAVPRSLILDFNESKHAADPRLPKVSFNIVNYSGSAGNTMFVFMRVVLQGSTATDSFLAGVDGRLSLDRLSELQSAFADAITSGVPSTVLSRSIRTEEPTALHDIQAAENAIGGVQRLESEVAICKRICTIMADKSVFASIGMSGLIAMVSRQVPHMSADVEGIAEWAMVQGGEGSVHVEWIGKQHERSIPSRRKLQGSVWSALARYIPPRFVKVRRCVTLMLFSCPAPYVINNYCSWMKPTELHALAKSEGFEGTANNIETSLDLFLKSLWSDIKFNEVPPAVKEDIDGRCENRMARLLCKKKIEKVKEFTHVSEVIDAAIDELEACLIYISVRITY